MTAESRRRPIVFGAPSMAGVRGPARDRIDLRSPARRGDFEALSGGSPGTVLLVDGFFGGALAVSPTECRELINQGWTLCGASSMGALRASELWPVGMIGIGDIFSLLRLEIVSADDELAVAYHPSTFVELTASIVHVRSVLFSAAAGSVSGAVVGRALSVAREIYWMDRDWSLLFNRWVAEGIPMGFVDRARILAKRRRCHPKVRDATLAVQLLLTKVWPGL